MQKLNVYILKQLGIAMAISCIAFSAMIWLTQLVRFLNMLVNGGAPFYIFLQLAGLTLPGFLSTILPFSVATAVLFTYHRLATDSELLVLQSAGMSRVTLIKPALIMGLLAGICVFFLNGYVSPLAQQELSRLREVAKSNFASAFLRPGFFNDAGNKMTVYARDKDEQGELHGLLIHDARNSQRPATIIAEKGLLAEGEKGDRIVVFNGSRQEFDRATNQLSELYFERYAVDLGFIKEEYAAHQERPDEMSLSKLWSSQSSQKDLAKVTDVGREIHTRIASGFLPLLFVLISLAVFLRGPHSRQGYGHKVAWAIVALSAMQAVLLWMTSMLSKSTMATSFYYAFIILPAFIAFVFLAQDRPFRLNQKGN